MAYEMKKKNYGTLDINDVMWDEADHVGFLIREKGFDDLTSVS